MLSLGRFRLLPGPRRESQKCGTARGKAGAPQPKRTQHSYGSHVLKLECGLSMVEMSRWTGASVVNKPATAQRLVIEVWVGTPGANKQRGQQAKGTGLKPTLQPSEQRHRLAYTSNTSFNTPGTNTAAAQATAGSQTHATQPAEQQLKPPACRKSATLPKQRSALTAALSAPEAAQQQLQQHQSAAEPGASSSTVSNVLSAVGGSSSAPDVYPAAASFTVGGPNDLMFSHLLHSAKSALAANDTSAAAEEGPTGVAFFQQKWASHRQQYTAGLQVQRIRAASAHCPRVVQGFDLAPSKPGA